ncbi:MAG: YeeE/YedE family protein, partial [Paracoccaceae bacterium]|nr:YeeE/YedE family protein [Paracoccaceae bacterium]
DLPMLALAGVLVGFGTRAANGCTSGHGVCGMSRFSLRSIVATGVYLAAGMVTFYLARHVMGAI